MHSIKSDVLVVASLFLVAGLIYTAVSIHPVFAAPPHPCFNGAKDYNCNCGNDPATLRATCCWFDPITGGEACQTCEVNTDTGEFENCGLESKGRPGSSTIAPLPSGVAPPPSTQTCPANTALDANGNCAPLTQGLTDQGTTLPPTNDNTDTKHHKGQLGGSLLNGDNNLPPSGHNNNKPSKHHKGSDTLTPSPLTDPGTP